MNNVKANKEAPFRIEIHVKGRIDKDWSDWFEGLAIAYPRENETVLTGPVADQAALYGLLANLGALGLALLSVNRIKDAE